MRSAHLRIDLLKLLVLLGVSAGLLPTRIKGLNNWFTNYIVADASDDVHEQHANQAQSNSTNVTSLVNGTLIGDQQLQLPVYNFSDSIVRVGVQPPAGGNELLPPPQVGENNQTAQGDSGQQQQQEQPIDQLTSRQDSAPLGLASLINPSATTAASYGGGGGGASNHKNYPVEPYPSASYTSLTVQVPSPTAASNVSPLTASQVSSGTSAAQAWTLNSMLNRDYHHSFNLSEHNNNNNNNLLSPNHRTNVPSSQIAQQQQQQQQAAKSQLGSPHADAQTAYAQILNHNFETGPNSYHAGDLAAAGAGSSLNTGLIQNLTAGLFPVAKLSNATLSSLSELLSKTKQQQQAGNFNAGGTSHLYGQSVANSYRSLSSAGHLAGAPQTQQSFQLPLQVASQQANNYLEALLGDHRFTSSVFDYLNQPPPGSAQQPPPPPPSQFGFREPNSVARLQSTAGLYNRATLAQQQQQQSTGAYAGSSQRHKLDGHSQTAAAPIPSNVYNTYAPFKEPQSAHANKPPPVTNGQMLNMAATLYDNYLDQNYRQNQQYQFVQQHQANNQNHLDKVVYHSTPFRPSIVSPPSSSQTLAGATTPSSSMISGGASNYQRPRTEADVKSVSHAPLSGGGGPNSHVMTSWQHTNGQQQQQNLSKPGIAYQPGRQVALGSTKFDDALDSPVMYQQQQQQQRTTNYSRFAPQTSGSQQQQQVSANGKQQVAAQRQPNANAASLVGPQLLLDLYERAIDSQIQEAIYSDHAQHFQHLGPLAAAAASSSSPGGSAGSATAATNSNAWPATAAAAAGASYDDAPYEPTTGYAMALTTSGSSRQPTSATAAAAAMAALMSSQQSLDPLASALSELPTFSASDLQPLIPGGATSEPVYSLSPPPSPLPAGSGEHSAPSGATTAADQSDASSLAALIAQFTAQPTGSHTPAHNQQPITAASGASSLHQLLLGDYDQFNSAYGPMQTAIPMASTVAPQTVTAIAQQPSLTQQGGSGSSSAASLPSIFTKFTQTGQLSSIFTSPFAHLYANLPRYRYTKQQQQQSKQPTRDQTTLATSGLNKQQAAAALAASAAASLIANSGHSLTPLQAAILQAQLATSAYLQADPSGVGGGGVGAATEQPTMASSMGIGSYSNPADFSGGAGQPPASSGLLGLASGLTGGGVSPAVWRNFLSPIMGARKQHTQNSVSGGGNQLNGSQRQQTTLTTGGGNIYPQRPSAQSLALVNSLWGATGGGGGGGSASGSLGQLLSASSPAAYESSQLTRAHAQKKPRLRIKILKIPVAFYADATAASSPTATSSHASADLNSPADGSSISLMPAHLQPSPTASLLASLAACPYHAQHPHQHQLAAGGSSSFAYPSQSSVSNLFGLPMSPVSPVDFSSPWSQSAVFSAPTQTQHHASQTQQSVAGKQVGGGSSAPSNSHTSTGTTTTTGANQGHGQSGSDHSGKPTPIRDFTDINQPNDLQVSPTSNLNFSATPMQQQHQHHHLRKSRA